MGLIDAFNKEDRVEVTFSDFYRLMRESAKAELMANAVKCDVPHCFIREMLTGTAEINAVPINGETEEEV